jgi:hypothetical protein
MNKEGGFKGKKMQRAYLQTIFIQWLNTTLRDEQWRAYVRAQLQQHELPVIDLALDNELQTTSDPIR